MSTPLLTAPEVLTVPEVMRALRLSRFKVYDLIRSRELASIKIGRCRRVPADALRTFIEHQLKEAA
ncbi:helix-turn-helix domain-containing protein [[Kitasatospora] papulosa]|uniref:helix-turn-helix domain-containing protein n=1 Tax=[Kitasatospora] papulosa TaxID=1464011 RepID=UPI00380FB6BF